jgi:hypothetical protein
MARCMLKAKELPGFFWGEAMLTVVHILNHAPMRTLDGKTLYEAWHSDHPTVHYFRVFGSIVHVKITRPNIRKLDDRNIKTIFISYEPGSKAYRYYNPVNKRIVVSRHVVFDEMAKWCWEDTGVEQGSDTEPFSVEYSTKLIHDITLVSPSPSPPPATHLRRSPHVTPRVTEILKIINK